MAHIRLESPRDSLSSNNSKTDHLFKLIDGSSSSPSNSAEKKGLFASFWKKPMIGKGGVRREFEHQALAGPSYSAESENTTESETNTGGEMDDAWNIGVEGRDEDAWGFGEDEDTPREDHSKHSIRDDGFPPLPPGIASKSARNKIKATTLGKGRHLNPKVLLARTAKKKEDDHKPKDFSLMQMISQSFDSESGLDALGNRDFVTSGDPGGMYPVQDHNLPVHPPPTPYAQIDLSGGITKVVPENCHGHDYLSPVPTSSDEYDQVVQQPEADLETIPSGEDDPPPASEEHDDPSASCDDGSPPLEVEEEESSLPSVEIDAVIPSFKDRLAFYKTQSHGKLEATSYPKPASIETSYLKPAGSSATVKGNETIVSHSSTRASQVHEPRPVRIQKGEKQAPDQNETIKPTSVDEGSSVPVMNRIKQFQATSTTTSTTPSSMGQSKSVSVGHSKQVTPQNGALTGVLPSIAEQRLVPIEGRNTNGKRICILVPDVDDSTGRKSPLYTARLSVPSKFQLEVPKGPLVAGGNKKLPSPSQSIVASNCQRGFESPDNASATMTLAQRKAAFLSSGRLSEGSIDTQRKDLDTLGGEVTKRPPPQPSRQSNIDLTTTDVAKNDNKVPMRSWSRPKIEIGHDAMKPSNHVQVGAKNDDDGVSNSSHGRVRALRSSIETTHASLSGNLNTKTVSPIVGLHTAKVSPKDSGLHAEKRFGSAPIETNAETTLQKQTKSPSFVSGAMSISDRKKAFAINPGESTNQAKGKETRSSNEGNEAHMVKLKNTRQSFKDKNSVATTSEQPVGSAIHQYKVVTKNSSTIPSETSDIRETQAKSDRAIGLQNKIQPQNGLGNSSARRSWVSSTNKVPTNEESDASSSLQHQSKLTVSLASRKKAFISNIQRTSKSGNSLFLDVDMLSSSTHSASDSAKLATPSDELSDHRTKQEEAEIFPSSVQRPSSTASLTKPATFDTEERFLSLAERKRVLALTAKGNEVSRQESKESDAIPKHQASAHGASDLKSTSLATKDIAPESSVEEPNGNDDPPMSIADRMRNLRNSFQQPNFAANTSVNAIPKRSWSVVGVVDVSSTRDGRNDELTKRIQQTESSTQGTDFVIDSKPSEPITATTSNAKSNSKPPITAMASKAKHFDREKISWIKEPQAMEAHQDATTIETQLNLPKPTSYVSTPPRPKERAKSIAVLTKAFEASGGSGDFHNSYTSLPNTLERSQPAHGDSPTKSPMRKVESERSGRLVARPELVGNVCNTQHPQDIQEHKVGADVAPAGMTRNLVSSRQFFEPRRNPMNEKLPVDAPKISDEPSATSTRDENSIGIFGAGEHPLYVVVDGSCNASECLSPSPRMLDRKVVEPGSGMSYFEQLQAHASGQSPLREGPSNGNRSEENDSSPMPLWCKKVNQEKEAMPGDTTTTVEKYHAVKCRFSQKALPWRQKSAADRYLERKRHTMSNMMQTPELGLDNVASSYPVKTRTSDLFCPIFNESLVGAEEKTMTYPNATPSRDHPPPSFRSPFGTPINGYNYGNTVTPK